MLSTIFEVRDPALHAAVAEDAKLRIIADGFTFTEGPIWHPSEEWLMFSDIARSKQWRWSEAEGLAIFRQPSNQANGNAFDREGRVVTCEHASSKLVRIEHDGKLVRVLAAHYEGKRLNSPNDVVVDPRGRIFFTDPTFGRTREDLGLIRKQELSFQGLFRYDPDGTLHLLADDFGQPNGLCFTREGSQLLVNDTAKRTIRAFSADGTSGGGIWAEVGGEGSEVEGSETWNPDGMKTDTDGRIWCTGPGGVHVFAPDATCLGVIYTPEKLTNFCFGGDGLRTLFITASTRVYAIDTLTTGLPAF